MDHGPRRTQVTSTTLPTVVRASMARWAWAASASLNGSFTTGRRRPAASSSSARVDSSSMPPGRVATRCADARRDRDPGHQQVTDRQWHRRARREAVHDHPAARRHELERGTTGGAADAVERDGDAAARLAHPIRPVVVAMVDHDVDADVTQERALGRAARGGDHGRTLPVRELHQQHPHTPGRGGEEDDVVGADPRHLGDAERGPSGADHRDRFGEVDPVGHAVQRIDRRDRERRVAARCRAEVRDDSSPEPVPVGAGAHAIDNPGDLAARRHRQRRRRQGPERGAAADRRVDQVHTGDLDGDANLA